MGGKLMVSTVVVLITLIIFMLALHLYARCYVSRYRQQQIERQPQVSCSRADRGLDRAVLNSLPVISLHAFQPEDDCAVCLLEFEEREIVRLLPNCGHSFHVHCIDMWFHSHSTCPICRKPVEEKAHALELGTSYGFEPGNSADDTIMPAGLRIEVPPPLMAEPQTELTQKLPAGRSLSLTRILSMGMRSPAETSRGVNELDLERADSVSRIGV
ncbi:RING-H2 finger protein ATL2 [Striga hermonthica]|uniref:RING-H2 finger protein ATL2 n=1 Tax=Striga hermonthica TaxID=68872 RepID=A0A9N7RLC6_STRHE|nr:RING-H2 finger protein ATL2 [Striga hermonthica]